MMTSLSKHAGRAAALALCALFAPFLARTASAGPATTARYAHVAAVLVDGRTLIAGGMNTANTPIATVEILDTNHGAMWVTPTQNSYATSMSFARSSATITVLPDGKVLVTGGWDGATARSDAEVYDPVANSWATVTTAMSAGRFDHTATLLNTGRVLICGGHTNMLGTVTGTCDLYTPNNIGSCVTAGGCIAATGSLLLPRALHTATLLNDGSVWIAGGWNNNGAENANPPWVVTTERYNPTTGVWQQSVPLNVARAYHTATATGDGKVIVTGGFNGRNLKDPNGFLTTLGVLQTTEIFDPTGGSIVPGPPLQARMHKHGAVLQADGQIALYGGRGNIASSHLVQTVDPIILSNDAYVSANVSTGVQNGYMNIPSTAGAGSINLNFFNDTPATGRIIDGEIDFTSANVSLNGAYADWVTADENNAAVGLRASLRGLDMDCDPSSGQCGRVRALNPLSLINMGQGGYHIVEPTDQANLITGPTVTGTLVFSPALINSASGSASVTSGNFTTQARFGLSSLVARWPIKNINCSLNLNDTVSWSQQSTYTVTLTGGSAAPAGSYVAQVSGPLVYIDIPSITFNNVTGDIVYTGAPGNAPVTSPFVFPATQIDVMTCSIDYMSEGLNIGGGTLKFDSYYVLIRDMISSDYEFYIPQTNQWSYTPANGSVSRPSKPAEGAAVLHLPDDDVLTVGGRTCNATCSTILAAPDSSVPANRQDYGILWNDSNFAKGGVDDIPHAYHSATLLNDGTILLAGGTDGSYVLPTAEVFDPVTSVFTPTEQQMHTPRQQHSANLLPNGRVLIAGGFATTLYSTGPTNTAELYYPDTHLFLNTPVMVSSHSQHAAVGLPNGNVFIAGGYDNGTTVTNVAEVFYATSSSWGRLANMPTGRAIAPAVQLQSGKILVCGGTNQSGILSSCDLYNPTANSWAGAAPMPTQLQGHTMTLMPDGRALVAGGNDGFGETDSSYLYDPVANSWSTTNLLVSPRFGHDATLLPNGTVMISGGVQQVAPGPSASANALRTVEFYHPMSAQWSDSSGTVKFAVSARSFHTATLAPDGNVYFFGGANGSIGAGQNTAFFTNYESDYFTAVPDVYSRVVPSVRQSTITTTTASPFLPNTTFDVTGLRFRGATEGSGGGAASANSSFNYPHLLLQKVGASGGASAASSPGFIVDLSTYIPAKVANLTTLDTHLSIDLPMNNSSLPYGWYMTWVGNSDVFSLKAPIVQVGPAKPSASVTGLNGVTQGVSSITYTWSWTGGSIDGFSVYSATNGVFLATIPVASPVFRQTNLLPNTTAGILVAGYTVTGDGPLSASATMYTLPTPPLTLTISSVTFNTLRLTWDPNGNLPGTIYEVGESSDDFVNNLSTPVPVILGLTNAFTTISNLQAATTYYFRVRAYNSAGLASNWTPSVSTLTRTSVTGLIGTAIDPNTVRWDWNDAGAVTSYRVYNATSGVLLATLPGNTLTYNDTGLGVDTPRAVSVTAITPAGEGPLSPPATTYTAAAQPGFVAPPITSISSGSISIQWAPNGNPNGIDYLVELIDYSSATDTVVTTNTTTNFTYGWGGLNAAAQFQIMVFGVNGDGVNSTPFVIGSTWTLPADPVNLRITGTTPISVSAAWDIAQASTNTFYRVTYSSDNFVTDVSTAIPLASRYNGSTVTITGLLTSATYWVRIQAANPFGQLSRIVGPVSTITFNGGAPYGSVAGLITAVGQSAFTGNLGNGRSISLRSNGGSFPSDTTVTISSYDATVPLCGGGLNVAFSIVANPAFQPTSPIYFSAAYNPAELGTTSPARISLMRYDPASGACVPLETTFDTVNHVFTAQLNHFSFYELVAVPLATDPGTLRIFPNPYRAAADSFITFDHVPPGARVRVMTLRGETVLDAVTNGTGLLTWRGTNGAGRPVASGLYLVIVESGGSKKISKLAVIR